MLGKMSRARPYRLPPTSGARLAVALVLGAGAVGAHAGCAPSPTALSWRIELLDGSTLGRAAVVDARILRGGCDGPEIYGVALRPRGAMALAPPVLEPGVWGFAASAHDASCVRFAEVCNAITLPGTTVRSIATATYFGL